MVSELRTCGSVAKLLLRSRALAVAPCLRAAPGALRRGRIVLL